ncbi:hypothetical protein B0J12DRAFT_742478 [Macrophomina phaseolina]|uniref:RING-type domain-containing protein n=1 Tax=Macrophomina phaseolina TaxID=35725 RepID=A0ABQ8G7J0_9PEZI|nr:hypothetical protein B0J12DRAFT_742478 [Macrophomina phaseolina]
MDDDPSLIEHPVARVLLAVIPAALVFLFFLSVLVVPVVQSVAEDGYCPQDVMGMLDASAPSMPYAAWLELQLQKASSLAYDNAICAICLDMVDRKDEVRDLACAHVFHTACLDSWVSRGHYYCPLCHRLVLPLLHDPQDAADQA